MCILQIQAQGYDRFFEVMPDEVENAELAVEDAFSQVLVELFGEGMVEEVTISFSTHAVLDLQHCSIHMRARCSYDSFTLRPRTLENIKLALATYLSSPLRELFGSASIDNISVNRVSEGFEQKRILSWGI